MILRLLRNCLIVLCILHGHLLKAQDVEDSPSNIYIAGFVLDKESGQGIFGAEIIVEFENKEILSLGSTEAGWFEATRPLLSEHVNRELRLTYVKYGYKFHQQFYVFSESARFIVVELEQRPENPFSMQGVSATGTIYGYVQDAAKNQSVPTAQVVLSVDKENVAIGYSRDSGYFSLNYPAKYRNQLATYTVLHPGFRSEKGAIELKQQRDLIRASLSEFVPSLEWLARYDFLLNSRGEISVGAEINLVHYARFIFRIFGDRQHEPQETRNFAWAVGVGLLGPVNSESRRNFTYIFQPEFSWRPYPEGKLSRFRTDFGIGAILIPRFPEPDVWGIGLQTGISYHFARRPSVFNNYHLRLGVSTSRIDGDQIWSGHVNFGF